MKITANLEFDTFAEAEKVFRHLGMLDNKPDTSLTTTLAETNAALYRHAHPTSASGAAEVKPAAEAHTTAPSDVSLEEVTASWRAYIDKKGGRSAATAVAILEAHGAVNASGVKSLKYAKPEQYAVLKRAFDTAGPDMPLGEAA